MALQDQFAVLLPEGLSAGRVSFLPAVFGQTAAEAAEFLRRCGRNWIRSADSGLAPGILVEGIDRRDKQPLEHMGEPCEVTEGIEGIDSGELHESPSALLRLRASARAGGLLRSPSYRPGRRRGPHGCAGTDRVRRRRPRSAPGSCRPGCRRRGRWERIWRSGYPAPPGPPPW